MCTCIFPDMERQAAATGTNDHSTSFAVGSEVCVTPMPALPAELDELTCCSYHKRAFLDHLAVLVAGEVDASSVTATALLETESLSSILAVKNVSAWTEQESQFLEQILAYARSIAVSGSRYLHIIH